MFVDKNSEKEGTTNNETMGGEDNLVSVEEENSVLPFSLQEYASKAEASLSKSLSNFMKRDKVSAYIKSYLHRNVMTCFDVSVSDDHLIVSSNTDQEVSQAITLLRREIVERVITLDHEAESAVKSKQWKQQIQELTCLYPWQAKVCKSRNFISVCAIKDYIELAVAFVFSFLDRNTKYTDSRTLAQPTYRLITEYHKDELQRIEEVNHIYHVTVKPDFTPRKITVCGTKQGIRNANLGIQQLLGRVISEFHVVSIPGVCLFVLSSKGEEVIQKVEQENSVVIQIVKSETREANNLTVIIHALGANKVVEAAKKSLDDMLTSHSTTMEIPFNQILDEGKKRAIRDICKPRNVDCVFCPWNLTLYGITFPVQRAFEKINVSCFKTKQSKIPRWKLS